MKLEDEFFEEDISKKNINFWLIGALSVSGFVLLILLVVVLTNPDRFSGHPVIPSSTETASDIADPTVGGLVSGSTLVSGDLDIWEEYQTEDENSLEEDLSESSTEETSSEEDKSENGTKVKVVHSDGKEEWIQINKYIPQNEFDDSFFTMGNGRLSYFVDGRDISTTGLNISGSRDYIDFHELKEDGIDFVMLRLGQRGYTTGTLQVDENFYDYITNAQNAGLDVGVTFYSQAVNTEEAVEEAEFVIDVLKDYKITYPVAYDMEVISWDDARTDSIQKEQKTQIAKAFLERIESEGYIGTLYGDKEWLLTKLNFVSLSNFDVWYSEEEDLPDFPYRFHMWEYGKGEVTGMSDLGKLTICLVDYSVK